jgi:tryptophan halogenase
MSNHIERVTIVGGGTAGWLTAIILNGALNKNSKAPVVKVTVIESPKVPTIGVGESTIQTLKRSLHDVGLNESEFIRRCNGSFKMGVHFIDWSEPKGGASSRFFHPLNNPPLCGGVTPAYHFRKFGPHWVGTSYGENVLPNAAVIAAGKGPRYLDGPDYQWEVNYAYHLDAALFAEFMRGFAVARGVEHIRDDVLDVFHDQSGAVSALQLERGGRYPVQFVVDCTGFRALIWSRMGAEPFISADDRLLNDRAIPLQIAHRDPTKIEPCTRATALGAGWVWRVPLFSRVGTGYVYSSAFRTDEQARDELYNHLRKVGDLASEALEIETRVIKMRIGYTRQPWIRNCVAIGLSSGFVEPLEATAIHTIDSAARRLVMNFPRKDFSPVLTKAYNDRATKLMEEIIDFLQLNYLVSNRTEPYWVTFREDARKSDWLLERLDLWKHRFPNSDDTIGRVMFNFANFLYLLYPKGYFSQIEPALERTIRFEDWKTYGQELKAEVSRLTSTLPSHYELLTKIRNPDSSQVRGPVAAPTLLRWPQ